MYDQSRNVISKISCLLLVATSLFAVAGCMGPVHYRGWLSRPVIVTVTDADTSKVVSCATVKLKAPVDMQRFLADKEKYEKVTDVNGKAELVVWFPCGGEQTLWLVPLMPTFDKGDFSLSGAGTLEVGAEGYQHFEREFVLLTGERHRSVNDKSSIEVHVKLLPYDTD